MDTLDCYQQLKKRLTRGELVATATVVRTKGSTPREPGAKMLVTGTGSWGTVGGGCGEAEVLAVALEMLSNGGTGTRLVRVELTEDITETADRICGGVMDVLVEVWSEVLDDLDVLTAPGPAGLIRLVAVAEGESPNCRALEQHDEVPPPVEEARRTALEKRRCTTVITPDGEFFLEFVGGLQTLLICGAGHIAQPLCQLAKMIGYRVVVIDDRPEFASTERFTAADQVLARSFGDALDSLEIGPETLAVLVTRGHRHDEFCLRKLLHTDAGYIGMLGSRRRVRAVFADLVTDGFTREQLQRIWAPIGIDIGALTPAEIAVSIMAEVVALGRDRTGGHMKLRLDDA